MVCATQLAVTDFEYEYCDAALPFVFELVKVTTVPEGSDSEQLKVLTLPLPMAQLPPALAVTSPCEL